MATTVTLNASAVGGTIQTANSGVITVPANGLITVNSADVPDLLRLGCQYLASVVTQQVVLYPRAASAGRIVASTAISNATLSIANQPDVPRQLAVVTFGGTSAAGAVGNIALTYTANDSTTQVDNFSLTTPASSNVTTNTSKGVVHLTSAIVTGFNTSAAATGIQINDTNALSMMVGLGFTSFNVLKETLTTLNNTADETVGTVASSAASITPTTAPATTNTYSFAYSYNAPNT